MIKINEYLSFMPSTQEPLSSNVFFVSGKDNTYIYDVGSSDETCNMIQSITNNKKIIISHFHADHLNNISRITYDDLYVSNYTYKHTNKGRIVKDPITILDGIKLEIIPVSSVHSKGSLLLNINNEYCLVGDLIHCDGLLNKSLYCMMIQDLEKVDTKYFVLGHNENCIHSKDELLVKLKQKITSI